MTNKNWFWFIAALSLLIFAWGVYEVNRRNVNTKTSKAIQQMDQIDGLEVNTESGRRQGQLMYAGPDVVKNPPSPLTNTHFGPVSYSPTEVYLKNGGTAQVAHVYGDEMINKAGSVQ